jgi:hypothetical protein
MTETNATIPDIEIIYDYTGCNSSNEFEHRYDLGRDITIPASANAVFNPAGLKINIPVESVSIIIGIGKDHTADLIMTKEAYNALREGAEVTTATMEEITKLMENDN